MRPFLQHQWYILFIKQTDSRRGNIHPFGAEGRGQRDGQNEPSSLPGSLILARTSRRGPRYIRARGSPPSGFCSRDGRHYFFSVDNSLPRCPSVFFPTAPYSHGKANAKYREERTDGTTAREAERGRKKKRRSRDTEEERRGAAPLSRGNGGTLRPHPAGASSVDRTMRTGARWFIEAARLSPLRWFALSAAAAVA